MGLSLRGDIIPWTRGVDIFFVISGFIIAVSAQRFFATPGGMRAFALRRFLRVAPLYYLFTTLMVALLVMMPGGAKDTQFDLGQILSSYLFFPYERADGRIAPVLSLGWTLNYEMFFYALFALCIPFRPKIGLTLAALLITALSLIGLVLPLDRAALVFWTNPLMMEFVFGMALGQLYLSGVCRRLQSTALALATLGLGMTLLIVLNSLPTLPPRFLASGVPAALIVTASTLFAPPLRAPRVGLLLGDASYALYLSHRFTLRAATLIVLPLLPTTHGAAWLYVGLVCVGGTIVSVAVFLWIERPMLARIDAGKIIPKRMPS